MALQADDIIVVQRPSTKVLYHCKVEDFAVDTTLATETNTGIVRLATLEEVIDGTRNDLAISPANMNLAFINANYVADGNSGAGSDYSGPATGFVASPTPNAIPGAASETEAGVVRLATAAETTEGTDNTIAITPFSLRSTLDNPAFVWDGGTYS